MEEDRIGGLLSCVIKVGEKEDFWEVENTVGQKWIFPVKNTQSFLSLFQPSSFKGKVVSKLLPYLRFFPLLASKIRVKKIKIGLDATIRDLISKSFGISDFEYGVFCGSPGNHQKLTLKINQGDKCVGYCKITDNEDVYSLFRKESSELEYLKGKGIRQIPECVYVGKVEKSSGVYLFMQTTRSVSSVRPARFDDECVVDFVLNLYRSSQVIMGYKDTCFFQSLEYLKENLSLFDKLEQGIIMESVRNVEKVLLEKSTYSFYHGDFTPWNSFVFDNDIFVFDFEYSQRHTVPYMDFFHFFTQTCIYSEYMEADAIFDKYMKNRDWIQCRINEPDLFFTCYLLNTMAFYLERDKGFLNQRIESCFKIWICLLKKIGYGICA